MKLQISVSAASPLTAFGKQVRALESQAAKARKLLDAAKEAEAAGKSIDSRVARLQEVLGSTGKPATVKASGADFAAQLKEGKAALRSYKVASSDVEAKAGATGAVLHFAGFQLRYAKADGWSVHGKAAGGFKELGRGKTAQEALDSTKAVQRLKTGVPAGRAAPKETAPKASAAPSGMYVFIAQSERDSDRLVEHSWVPVRSTADAEKKVGAYIHKNGLGGSTWIGGLLVKDGKIIGHVSHNGKYDPDVNSQYIKNYGKRFLRMLK